MNSEGLEAVRWMLILVVLAVAICVAVVAGFMLLATIWVSPKTAGFIFCALLGVGAIAFFSWLVYDDAKFCSEQKKR